MVIALQDGEQGMLDMMQAARDAGGVLRSDLIETAAEVDDRLDAIALNIRTNVSTAILSVVDAIDSTREALARLGGGAAGADAWADFPAFRVEWTLPSGPQPCCA